MKHIFVLTFLLLVCSTPIQAQFSDEFNTESLETGWSWVRESPDNWRLGGGEMTIWTETGALNGPSFNNVRNILLQPLTNDENFMMDTELRFEPYYTLRNAGLVYFIDEDNYIRVSRGINEGHNDIWMEWETDGETHFVYAAAEVGTLQEPLLEFRLRLTRRSGNEFSASYQIYTLAGEWTSWNSFSTETIDFPANATRIGIQAANGDGFMATTSPVPAEFDYFHFDKTTSVRPIRESAVAFTIEAVHPSPAVTGSVLTMVVSNDRSAVMQWRMTDLLGREVIAAQSLGYRESGTHSVSFSTGSLPPGVYLWQITSGTSRATRRILLTR